MGSGESGVLMLSLCTSSRGFLEAEIRHKAMGSAGLRMTSFILTVMANIDC